MRGDGQSAGMRAERRAAVEQLRMEVIGTQEVVSSELAGLTLWHKRAAADRSPADDAVIDRLLAIEASLVTIERHWVEYLARFPLAGLEVGAQSRIENFARSAA